MPLNKVRGEFFSPFTARAASSKTSRQDYERSKASLQVRLRTIDEVSDVMLPVLLHG